MAENLWVCTLCLFSPLSLQHFKTTEYLILTLDMSCMNWKSMAQRVYLCFYICSKQPLLPERQVHFLWTCQLSSSTKLWIGCGLAFSAFCLFVKGFFDLGRVWLGFFASYWFWMCYFFKICLCSLVFWRTLVQDLSRYLQNWRGSIYWSSHFILY